jgi:hypothetical protein
LDAELADDLVDFDRDRPDMVLLRKIHQHDQTARVADTAEIGCRERLLPVAAGCSAVAACCCRLLDFHCEYAGICHAGCCLLLLVACAVANNVT